MTAIDRLRDIAVNLATEAAERSELGFSPAALNIDRLVDEIERTYIKLPVDADGVPIKPGDYMALGDSRGEVKALSYAPYNELPWQMQLDEYEWYAIVNARHVKQDTVEGLLKEFALATDYAGDWNNTDDADERRRQVDALVAGYAERIRKVVEQ